MNRQVAYIFDPEDDGTQKKSVKRKRVSRQAQKDEESIKDSSSSFVPLLNGAEKPEFVHLRETLFEESWTKVDKRIQVSVCDFSLKPFLPKNRKLSGIPIWKLYTKSVISSMMQ
jgi:hypothetical protein